MSEEETGILIEIMDYELYSDDSSGSNSNSYEDVIFDIRGRAVNSVEECWPLPSETSSSGSELGGVEEEPGGIMIVEDDQTVPLYEIISEFTINEDWGSKSEIRINWSCSKMTQLVYLVLKRNEQAIRKQVHQLNKELVNKTTGQFTNSFGRRFSSVSPLWMACWTGQESLAKLLVEHGADVNVPAVQDDFGPIPISPLRAAVMGSSTGLVLYLMSKGAYCNHGTHYWPCRPKKWKIHKMKLKGLNNKADFLIPETPS